MHSFIFILVFFGVGLSVYGQGDSAESSLMNKKSIPAFYSSWGTGFFLNFGEINNQKALFPGVEGGIQLNQNMSLGLRFAVFTGNFEELFYDQIDTLQSVYLEGAFGGFCFEPIVFGGKPVHITFPIMAGLSSISYNSRDEIIPVNNGGKTEYVRKNIDCDAMLLLEPGINIEFRISHHVKIATGVSYRMFQNVDLMCTSKNCFNGISGNIRVKFGKFK